VSEAVWSAAARFFVLLTYPVGLSLWLLAFGVVAWVLRRRRLGGALMVFALAWSVLWSVPQFSEWLRAPLERQHHVVQAAVLPEADAIVVLGGGAVNQTRGSSRLAAAAHAWTAGRAPLVILSGGGGRFGTGRGRSEAERMAGAIVGLGVPRSALVLEERSRNTQENAEFTAALARQRGIRRVLLVTSSLHMPRASLLFNDVGVDVVPVPAPERSLQRDWRDRWIPTRRALWRSGRALKEYAGLLALHAGIVPEAEPRLACTR
jgi:uncharacterized SAM-binding protein YcdF (DUF218 family)